jgi:hypothetical protein
VQPDRDVWQLPRGTFIKVNFDDAYETNSGAWGFIARSDDRSFILVEPSRSVNVTRLDNARHQPNAAYKPLYRWNNVLIIRDYN